MSTRRRPRIAILSKSDGRGGGAGRVAQDLADWLNAAPDCPFEIHHWSGAPNEGNRPRPHHRPLHGRGAAARGLFRLARLLSRQLGYADFLPLELLYFLLAREGEYDLYHVHDISSAISPLTLGWLARRAPLVWTFHDMSPLTGGCIAPDNCEAWLGRCGACPQLRDWPLLSRIDRTGWMQEHKRSLVRSSGLQPVVPSYWLVRQMERCAFPSRPPVQIPNPVDMTEFRPRPRVELRARLGLPEKAFILLVSGVSYHTPLKGAGYLASVLSGLDHAVFVLHVGSIDPRLEAELAAFEGLRTGYLEQRCRLAEYYAAADLLLHTSRAESSGNIVSETMACGTPAAAFGCGGVGEQIQQDSNGWLAEVGDVTGLIRGINLAIEEPDRLARWSEAALVTAQRQRDPAHFVQAHLALYRGLLSGDRVVE